MTIPAYRRATDLRLAVVATALTALATAVAGSTTLEQVDRAAFRHINSLPDLLYRPLWWTQLTGVLGAPLIVALVALAAHRFRLACGLALLIPAKLVVERDIMKALVDHPRPGAAIPGAVVRGVATAGSAFPSGHAVILFGVVALLWPYLSRWGRPVVVAAAIIAAGARVYLGAHTPIDVVGGATAGLAVAAMINLVVGVAHSDSGIRDE